MIKKTLFLTGGKGGVGKSTVAAGLARSLASNGYQIGLLDADLSGPSQSILFNSSELSVINEEIIPVYIDNVYLVSIGQVVENETPLIWSPGVIAETIRTFSVNVKWGNLDLLIIDLSPGLGDIHINLHKLYPLAWILFVTTGSKLAVGDCRREISFFQKMESPILGIVENFAYFTCPETGKLHKFYDSEDLIQMAKAIDIKILDHFEWSDDLAYGKGMKNLITASKAWLDKT